jgi:hypothetical protein
MTITTWFSLTPSALIDATIVEVVVRSNVTRVTVAAHNDVIHAQVEVSSNIRIGSLTAMVTVALKDIMIVAISVLALDGVSVWDAEVVDL